MSNAAYQGQCLCGAIQYEADKVSNKMGHCHCTMCRKFHGAAFATFGSVANSNFRWLAGENLLQTYLAENGTKRKFCSQCGSSLIFESAEDNGLIEFSLATLDISPAISPDAHIYTGSKVDWLTIDDDLPKYLNGRCS
ncbi:MAG: hypothetical protein ACJA2E_001976 [Arenicella sp.]|jgi:hypothetical protein